MFFRKPHWQLKHDEEYIFLAYEKLREYDGKTLTMALRVGMPVPLPFVVDKGLQVNGCHKMSSHHIKGEERYGFPISSIKLG